MTAKTQIAVIFKKEGKDVLAVFPTEAGTNDPYTCGCYAHFGQHASCNANYAAALKPATPSEYAGLKRELEQMGYKLEVRSRFSQRDLAERKAQVR